MPVRTVAERPAWADWPETLQRLYRACVAAHDAWQELEEIVQAHAYASHATAQLCSLEAAAYASWRSLEAYTAPLIDSWEAYTEEQDTPHEGCCTACGWRGLAVSSDCPACGALAIVRAGWPASQEPGEEETEQGGAQNG